MPAEFPDSILLAASLKLDAAAGTFEMTAYDGGLLHVAEYPLPVVVDLTGMAAAPQVKALLFHDPARPAGHMTEVEIDRTITSRGHLSVPEAQEYLRAAQQRGFQGEASISEQSNRRASQSRFTDAMCVFRQRTLANSSVW